MMAGCYPVPMTRDSPPEPQDKETISVGKGDATHLGTSVSEVIYTAPTNRTHMLCK